MGTKFRRETEARQLCYVICHRLYIFICYWSTAASDVCFCLVDCFLVVMGFYYWYAFCCYGIADQTFLCVCVLQTSVFMASLFGISLHAMCLHIQYYKKILHIYRFIYIYTNVHSLTWTILFLFTVFVNSSHDSISVLFCTGSICTKAFWFEWMVCKLTWMCRDVLQKFLWLTRPILEGSAAL